MRIKNKPVIVTMLVCVMFTSLSSLAVASKPISSKEIDALVERSLKTFEVPGMAVAVIKDGKVIHQKGYGVRSLNTMEAVDEDTLFSIASLTKAFTTTAIAQLVDQGKIHWDDKVIKYIPEFRLYNDYVTKDFMIRDLLVHRSGMGLGAGDLMFFPDGNSFTIDDIIGNLRYLKQTSPFRSKYDYDNLLYMVAGEVVRRVSGMSWEDYVESKIMKPLGMTASVSTYERLHGPQNIIDAHAPINGQVQVIPRFQSPYGKNSSGGIHASINDMSKWALVHLNQGRYGKDLEQRLFSEVSHREMWRAQTNRDVQPSKYHTHFNAYGLGWNLSDACGNLKVDHTGWRPGMVTQITLIPDINLGILVLTNQQQTEAYRAVTNTILDSYLDVEQEDWVAKCKEQLDRDRENAQRITDEVWQKVNSTLSQNATKIDLAPFVGTYQDRWFGTVILFMKDGRLFFKSEKSPRLTGEVIYYKNHTFVAKWKDRTLDADAFLEFDLNEKGIIAGFKMKAISPLTDFSYDFHDLDFVRVVR